MFDNPIPGDDYQKAHLSKVNLPEDYSERICKWLQNPQRMLVFLGNPGVGKSYLCAAIINQRRDEKKYFWYFKEEALFAKLRGVISEGNDYNETIKSICENEFLILDDLGSSKLSDWQKEVLMSFIDFRSINGLPTVITSNLFTHDLNNTFHPRIVSRLKDKRNLFMELNWIDKRQE